MNASSPHCTLVLRIDEGRQSVWQNHLCLTRKEVLSGYIGRVDANWCACAVVDSVPESRERCGPSRRQGRHSHPWHAHIRKIRISTFYTNTVSVLTASTRPSWDVDAVKPPPEHTECRLFRRTHGGSLIPFPIL